MMNSVRFPYPLRWCRVVVISAGLAGLFQAPWLLRADDRGGFVEVAGPGVYRLTFEEIVTAGVEIPPDGVPVLSRGGIPLPHWLIDGNSNGTFEKGDEMEFVLQPALPGSDPQDRFPAVLRLRFAPRHASETEAGTVEKAAVAGLAGVQLEAYGSLEENLLRVPDPGRRVMENVASGWARLSSLDEVPFELNLSSSPTWKWIDPSRIDLRVRVQGLTWLADPEPGIADHSLECEIGSRRLQTQWSGREGTTLEWRSVNPGDAATTLRLRVPERLRQDGRSHLADVSILDWVEWAAPPLSGLLGAPSGTVPLRRPAEADPLEPLSLELPESVGPRFLHDENGGRWSFPPAGGSFTIDAPGTGRFLLVLGESTSEGLVLWANRAVLPEERSGVRAESLWIVPDQLMAGAEALAAVHRSFGRSCEMASVSGIIDGFGHGRLSAQAVQSAIRDWLQGSPNGGGRNVLLVGDASTERPGSGRNLIPTWTTSLGGSLCATDHPYACVVGDDIIPDLAVGRLPVTTNAELEVYAAKVAGILAAPKSQPGALLVVDHDPVNQEKSRPLIGRIESAGASVAKIFAHSEEDGGRRLEQLRRELARGPDWVFYYGHGARHLWRTGPADYSAQSSLFTSDHLSGFAATPESRSARIVVSFTCDNAPFDHVTDDSLGERFVTIPFGGSAAFVGASWRVQNSVPVVEAWTEAVCTSTTVGEAFVKAKAAIATSRFLHSYNLLGDPALPLR